MTSFTEEQQAVIDNPDSTLSELVDIPGVSGKRLRQTPDVREIVIEHNRKKRDRKANSSAKVWD